MKKLIWHDVAIEIPDKLLLTEEVLKEKISSFWDSNIKVLPGFIKNESHIAIMIRVRFEDLGYKTLGNLKRLNKNNKIDYIDYIKGYIQINTDAYINQAINQISFQYALIEGTLPDNAINVSKTTKYLNHRKMKLPLTFNPLEYGTLLHFSHNTWHIKINKTSDAIIIRSKDGTENKVKFFTSGKYMFEYKDKYIDENIFERVLDHKTFRVVDNEIVLFESAKSGFFIDKLIQNQGNNEFKFFTLDIETFKNKENNLIPLSISFYDGVKCFSNYLTDFDSPQEMISVAFSSLLRRKNRHMKGYVHNLAKFDIYFILPVLEKLGTIKPLIYNGRLISIQLTSPRGYSITLKDSYQLLPSSLAKLAKNFNVEDKGIFPYEYPNENNLAYSGDVPSKFFFKTITDQEYLEYKNSYTEGREWSLKEETINYCENDCKVLYQIMSKFSHIIDTKFNISLDRYPTLSSLSFGIYRQNYLTPNTIPKISGNIYDDIKQSYTGGAVDMYKPYFKANSDKPFLYCYDVNSLYPYVMSKYDMPVGKPVYFEGNPYIKHNDPFGFFHCKITSPTSLEHPILQTHVKTNDGIRTIAPLGSWSGWYFSEELKNALNFGYQFEIIRGYLFERQNIFNKFINDLYKFRMEFPKSNPLNLVAKLIMNSHYGRYGMPAIMPETKVVIDIDNSLLNENITEIANLKYTKVIQYITEERIRKLEIDPSLAGNVSIGISAAITAYGRIVMSKLKNNPDMTLYYSDTDSVYVDKPLDDSLVSSTELGKLKLENKITEAIFLAPKVYCLINEDNKYISKVKGLSHDVEVSYMDFLSLLNKEVTLEKVQTKWFKNFSEDTIKIKDQLYTLKATSNKRELVYENNLLRDTKPYYIKESDDGTKILTTL